MLKILHTISGLWKHTGGPAESVPGLCTALVSEGCKVTLATLSGQIADTVLKSKDEGVNIQLFKPNFRHTIWYSSEMARKLPSIALQADVVHVHGLWEHPMWLGGKVARQLNIPLVISPRGSLNPTALKRSRWKKRVVAVLFDHRNLRAAACLHATTDIEYKGFRDYGLTNPVAIIPNAVNFSTFDVPPAVEIIKERFPACRGKLLILYMSRINPTKGLLNLAQAWGEVAPKYPDWHLLIAGPDERGHLSEVKKAFKRYGASNQVTYTGPLYGRERSAAFALTELFILPTHTENFGIVIAEALSAGIPVITTHGAPWSELKESNCGWWVPIGTEHLTKALKEAMGLSTNERRNMGANGRALIESKYTWKQIAAKMVDVYNWILHGGSTPDCIRLN